MLSKASRVAPRLIKNLVPSSAKPLGFSISKRAFTTDTILLEIRRFTEKNKNHAREPEKIHYFINSLIEETRHRPLHQPLFIQSVEEVISSLKPFLALHPKYLEVIPLLCVPDQMHIFQVPWIDDNDMQRVNTGYRVQFNQALGPYKGGLRFHPSVDLSVMKFLGFEQTFKNALTGLPIGGAKGGADFDPKGKSTREIFKFCESFMTKLNDYIGPDKDVPAGDIGVGAREIGYMYGHYKRLTNTFHGAMTGKGLGWGGSHLRPEATGYGLVYITDCYLRHKGQALEKKRCLVSGSGNVAQYAAEKLLEMGAVVLTLSDSNGTIYNENGFTKEAIDAIKELKNKRQRCKALLDRFPDTEYFENKKPWEIAKAAHLAFPCATQNELNKADAERLAEMKCQGVFEGANMPCDNEAIRVLVESKVAYIPGKAANAGGVAVSCFEMAQNSSRLVWTRKKVDRMLMKIMGNIFRDSARCAEELGDKDNFQLGANTVGFKRLADAMFQQGLVFHPET